MPHLTIENGFKIEARAFSGTPLLHDILPEVEAPCGGKGICGKCIVRASGALSEPTQKERDVLLKTGLSSGLRLACQTTVLGDARVTLLQQGALQNIEVFGELPAYRENPMIGRFGAAIDIGTTTVALKLVDLLNCRIIAETACENPQRAVAADVIGRIEAALEGRGTYLYSLIRDALDDLIADACRLSGIARDLLDVQIVTGNTTMLYLLTGRNPESLARAPFLADELFGKFDGQRYYPYCISAFVGADITCAVLAARMTERAETALLIDIGTNGEIALWHQGRLYCCATAAGPAFEGSGIACGSGSVVGAIDSVRAEEARFILHTIGEAPAASLCGSGVLDTVACLLSTGALDETGALAGEEVSLSKNVYFTQADVRAVQLAKGAIAAGMKTLCGHIGLSFEAIDTLYIAGGFGRHLNLQNAVQIGLIPECLLPRARVLGNASLAGAMLHLLDQDSFIKASRIAKEAEVVVLSGNPAFSDNYMDCMMIEPLE